MQVGHIARAVEFEKVVPVHVRKSIDLTRQRMAVQHLLDTRENDDTLITRLEQYVVTFHNVLRQLDTATPLQAQPMFEWNVGNETLESCCWRLEAILPRHALAQLHEQRGLKLAADRKYQDAAKQFQAAKQWRLQILTELEGWTWKLPDMNHPILQTKWQRAQIYHTNSLHHLCTLSKGVEINTAAKHLYTVAQRAVRDAAKAVAEWPTLDSTLPLAEAMRYYYSSDVLWSHEQYGASIHTLQHWLTGNDCACGVFTILEEQLHKVPLLLKERTRTNNGAYFDVVAPAEPLISPMDLIHTSTNDVPHPTEDSPPEEHALAAAHDDGPHAQDA